MCVRKSSLYASLPLPSIPLELPPSPCAEKVNAFSDFHIRIRFFGSLNNYNGFITFKVAQYMLSLFGDKL